MLKLVFKGIKIKDKKKFTIYTILYGVTFVLFCILCTVEGLMALRIQDIAGILLLFPGMSYAVYHGPLIAILYTVMSFFEVLFIAWQTNLEGQRLTRFVLFFLAINLVMTVVGLTIGDGIGFTLVMLLVLAIMIVLPTVIVVKVMEKRGTYDYSDIMTPEEIEEYKRRKSADYIE